MNDNTCIFCGKTIPEGYQVCFNCEKDLSNPGSSSVKMPTDKQIFLADAIAETLEIDFPQSSKDFTAATYWKFISDHIDEAKQYWEQWIEEVEEYVNKEV